VAAATIELLEVLTAAPLQASSVLIVLNKRLTFCQMFSNFVIKFACSVTLKAVPNLEYIGDKCVVALFARHQKLVGSVVNIAPVI